MSLTRPESLSQPSGEPRRTPRVDRGCPAVDGPGYGDSVSLLRSCRRASDPPTDVFPNSYVVNLDVSHCRCRRIRAVQLGLRVKNPMHRSVRNTTGGGADDVAGTDETAEVWLPLDHRCVPVGELRCGLVRVLIISSGAV